MAQLPADALYLSRTDENNLLSSCSPHPILLDDRLWPTVEHYFQAAQFVDEGLKQQISEEANLVSVKKLGKSWFKKRIDNWKNIRKIYMTRGIYTKCHAHETVRQALLDTGDQYIVENSLYDYYWGAGRDLRGDNQFGQVLMDVRSKLREEKQAG